MNTLLATLLSGSGNQFDYTYSLAAEVGAVAQADADWDMASNWQVNTTGLRLGYQLNDNFDMLGSVHWGTQSNGSGYDYYYYEEYDDSHNSSMSGYEIQVSETLIHLGPKMSWNINSWLAPYATAQGLLIHNRLQMSDSASFDEDSKTLIDDSGLAFGATGALGLEIRTRPIAKKAQLFFYGETGASAATALNFSLQGAGADEGDINIGDLGYGGSYFRVGAGTKF